MHIQKKTFTKWMNSFLLKAKMEVDDMADEGEFFISDERVADKMETVEALLSLSSSTRSGGSSPEKTLITILPAHNPDKGEPLKKVVGGR